MKKLIIYGASFFDVIKLTDAINRKSPEWEIMGFLDDTEGLQGQVLRGYKVLGGKELLKDLAGEKDIYFFNNVCGHWRRAEKVADLLVSYGCKIPNLIHPSIDMNYVEMGRGCILPEGCLVGGWTEIGNFVTVRLGCVISHDVILEDFVFIGSGSTVSSEAVVKRGVFIGSGVTVMLKITVGEGSLIGAGAVVTKNVPPGVVVAGVPAKVVGERE